MSRAPLSLSETLNIAIQVADALSAAHKAGIIHRDIKPENIMLRPDGYVKVLDFGLAKLSEQATPAVAAEAPTIQVRTGSGIVIGTAGYMSPEQARGLGVDHRSDIFSLGAVIYEMLARRKPFEGDTPSDTLAAILKTEPPPLCAYRAGSSLGTGAHRQQVAAKGSRRTLSGRQRSLARSEGTQTGARVSGQAGSLCCD